MAVLGAEPVVLALAAAAVLAGGVVAGLNGFGFALVGTASLAALLDPRTAVVVMLVPVLAANASLARDLDRSGLSACARRFGVYVAAALAGTLVGMALLTRVPVRPLALGLGLLTLAYVAVAWDAVPVPALGWVRDRCFVERRPVQAALGFASGLVFGASNVGVQVVAYLQSRGLDRPTFIGVMATVFLGISSLRVAAAAVLGLYPGLDAVLLSLAAVVPGLAGVALGKRVRARTPERVKRVAAFGLLSAIGLRLVTASL